MPRRENADMRPAGERISVLETKLDAGELLQKDRHAENSQKLDEIISDLREVKAQVKLTNGRVTALEIENSARDRVSVVRLKKFDEVCNDVELIKDSQLLTKGETDHSRRMVARLWDSFSAPLITTLFVGLLLLIVKKVWGL